MPKSYGELVRGYREAAGLTQEELATLSGLGVRTISDIERGRTARPHRNSAARLSRALGRDDLARALVAAPPAAAGNPGPATATAGDAHGRDRRAVPQQLPGGVRHFTGRAAELAALTGMLGTADTCGHGMAVVSAIGGTAGVGKTALAVHWAHQVAGQFPDGQLYVNLRGYDPARPMSPADALAGFLRALGVTGRDIPAAADERAARFRSLVAGRRMLVVLDNARSEEQVRPLLPGSSACVTVVTSRDSLAGLVARDGATRLDLDALPLAEAAGLLQALIGERARADPRSTEALAGQCCQLPLALRVAAEIAVARPGDSLASLVTEFTDQQRRLDLLNADGDPRTTVRAVFSWSYQHLDADAARVFRLAGLHPGPDFDAFAAAALTGGTTVDQAGRLLDRLVRAHLIHSTGRGRYGLHDLLRAYAAGQAAARDGEAAARVALTRLFDHYLRTAAAAMDVLVPAERHRRPDVPAPGALLVAMTDPAAAQAWLDAERAVLVAVAVHAAEQGWPGHATGLAGTLFRYLDTCAYYPEGVTVHTSAAAAARDAGDQAAEASALISLGVMNSRQARFAEAARCTQQALELFRQTADKPGEAYALGNLGEVALQQSRYPQATRYLRQALPLFRQVGDLTGEAYALNSFGEIDVRQGRYPQASGHYQQARELFRRSGDLTGEGYTLSNLGDVDLRLGRYPQAVSQVRQALELFRRTGHKYGEGYALMNLGEADLRQGRYPQAAAHYRQSLALFRAVGYQAGEAYALAGLGDIALRQGSQAEALRHQREALALCDGSGDPFGAAVARNGLGEALLAAGRPGEARTQHLTALTLARQTGNKQQQARAWHGLGRLHQAGGDHNQARRHWKRALVLYSGLGAPEADQLRDALRDPELRTGS